MGDSTMTFGFDLVSLVILGILALCALVQARRGGIRSFISFALVTAAALVAFFGARPIAEMMMEVDISALNIALPSGEVATNLEALIMGFINSQEMVADIVSASPAIESLILQLPVAVVSLILFLVIFILLKPVTVILYGFFKLFVPKRDAYGRKRKKNYFAGLLFCLARTLVAVSVLMVPVVGIYNVLEVTIPELEKTSFAEDESMKEIFDAGKGAVEDYTTSVTYGIMNTVQLKTLYQMGFDKLTEIELQDGSKTPLFTEITKLLPVAGEAMKLAEIDFENLKSEDIGTLANILINLAESDMAADIMADVLKDAANDILNGEGAFGITLSDMDPATADMMRDVFGAFSEADKASVQQDLAVIGGCLEVVKDAGLIEELFTDSGEVNLDGLLDAISEKMDEEDSTFVDDIFAELEKSPRLAPLTGSLTNFAMSQGAAALGIPYNAGAVHDTMISDVNNTLNNNNVAEINMATVHAEIERQAGNSPAVRLPYRVTLLSAGEGNDYQRFMDAFLGLIDAVDNAAPKYEEGIDGDDIVYPILGATYRYNKSEMRWTLVPAGAEVKSSVAAVLAKEIVIAAQAGKVNESDKSFTAEQVTAVIKNVADNSGAAAPIKAVAAKLADKENFVTTKITFKADIAINAANTDTKKLASALNDILVVAKDVLVALPGEGEDSGDSNMINTLLSGDTLKKLGSALDKLNEIEKPSENPEAPKKNISANLLQGVVNTLPDDESSKPLKDTLNQVIEGVKDPNKDVNFEDVLGGVGDASSAILGLLDYIEIEDPTEEDHNNAVEKLSVGLAGIRNMKADALDLLKDSLLSNVKDMIPEDSEDISELLTNLIDKIAEYKKGTSLTPEDLKGDAEALISLYEYIAEDKVGVGSHEVLTTIMNKIESSELMVFVTTDILQELADTLLVSDDADASYLGIVIPKDEIFTAAYIGGTTTGMGDRFVTELFTIVASEAFLTDSKANLALAVEILEFFVEQPGASLADTVNSAKTANLSLAELELTGTVFAGLLTIYAE